MFIPIVMVFIMSEITDFLYFFVIIAKHFVTVWAIYLNTRGRNYWVIAENGMVNRLWT